MPYGLTETPTGHSGIAMVALANMIAESATFQAASGGSAADRVRIAEYPFDDDHKDDGGYDRPFALVVTPGGDTSSAEGVGEFGMSGELEVWIEQDIPEAYRTAEKAADAEIHFKNFVDGIIADCQELSHQPGYLITRRWIRPEGPGKIDEEEVYAYAERISVSWGLGG